MGLHLERLRLLKQKRSIVGWILVIAAFLWQRLGDWQNIEYLQSKHLFPTALPNMPLSTSITIVLFVCGLAWLTAVLAWPKRPALAGGESDNVRQQPKTESTDSRLALMQERQRLEAKLQPLVEIEEGPIQVHPLVEMVPSESDYRREEIKRIRRDIADIDRQLGSTSVPAAAERYGRPKQPTPNLQHANLRNAPLYLEDGVWTDKPNWPSKHSVFAILIDVVNVPLASGPIGPASVKVCVQRHDQSQPLCSLWWLYYRANTVNIGKASRKTLVIATGPLFGTFDQRPWCFPLNLRDEDATEGYGAPALPVQIDHSYISDKDFTFDLIVVDAETGGRLGKWTLRWEMHGAGIAAVPTVTIVG